MEEIHAFFPQSRRVSVKKEILRASGELGIKFARAVNIGGVIKAGIHGRSWNSPS